jgi:hypothetical protein
LSQDYGHLPDLLDQCPPHGDVVFDFELAVKGTGPTASRTSTGPLVQGPPGDRFVYFDVGTYAGQKVTSWWAQRMKVLLRGITAALLNQVIDNAGYALEARIPGTAKDGGADCATVTLLENWKARPLYRQLQIRRGYTSSSAARFNPAARS